MGKIEKATTDDLGVKVSGSARTGHTIKLTWESALCRIFGTSDEMQANALLSHCPKPCNRRTAVSEVGLFSEASMREPILGKFPNDFG